MFSNNGREKEMTGATTLVSLVGLAYSWRNSDSRVL